MSDLIVPGSAKIVQGRIEDPDRLGRMHGWTVLGVAGWMFTAVAASDLVLDVVAMRGASGDWRGAAANGLIAGLLVPAFGLVLVLSSAVGRRKPGSVRAVSAAFALLAVISAAAGYYLLSTSVAAADRTMSEAALTAAQQVVTRQAIRALIHTIGFGIISAAGWKYT